jgi:hypothetical protein
MHFLIRFFWWTPPPPPPSPEEGRLKGFKYIQSVQDPIYVGFGVRTHKSSRAKPAYDENCETACLTCDSILYMLVIYTFAYCFCIHLSQVPEKHVSFCCKTERVEYFVICLMVSNFFEAWARIFKRLWSPGIDSKKWIPLAYVAWRAGTITLFLLGVLFP